MKLVRTAAAAAAGLSLVIAGNSGAATKPACMLVTDAAGDSNGIALGSPVPATSGGPTTDALDITSVDVASDAKNVTAVLRVKKLAATSSSAPTGLGWTVNFTVNATTFSFAAHSNPVGTVTFDAAHSSVGTNSLYGAGVTGVFDTTANEVRISAPVSLLVQESFKAGAKITEIGGIAGQDIAIPDATGLFGGGAILEGTVNNADVTTAGQDYVAGKTSCVKPGK